MEVKAKEYPDVWEYSDEYPVPSKELGWVPEKEKIKEFVDIFLKDEFFLKIVFWRYQAGSYQVIDSLIQARSYREHIEREVLTGHCSVLFLSASPERFALSILKSGHYGIPRTINIGSGGKNDPFDKAQGQDVTFITSKMFSNCEKIFTFSHDAEYLYEIMGMK
jgi:hypothetical protein